MDYNEYYSYLIRGHELDLLLPLEKTAYFRNVYLYNPNYNNLNNYFLNVEEFLTYSKLNTATAYTLHFLDTLSDNNYYENLKQMRNNPHLILNSHTDLYEEIKKLTVKSEKYRNNLLRNGKVYEKMMFHMQFTQSNDVLYWHVRDFDRYMQLPSLREFYIPTLKFLAVNHYYPTIEDALEPDEILNNFLDLLEKMPLNNVNLARAQNIGFNCDSDNFNLSNSINKQRKLFNQTHNAFYIEKLSGIPCEFSDYIAHHYEPKPINRLQINLLINEIKSLTIQERRKFIEGLLKNH